jgi:hypothetical protein
VLVSGNGVVLFRTTSAAMRSEKVLAEAGLMIALVPTPRQFTSDCGLALRFPWEKADLVRALLSAAHIEASGIHRLF